MGSLLRQGGVIDDEKSRCIAHQPICFLHQHFLERSAAPNPRSDKMMKLIIADLARSRCHRLNALTVSWAYQTCYVGGAHPTARLVPKSDEKRRSEEHTSELQSLMRISYAVFSL